MKSNILSVFSKLILAILVLLTTSGCGKIVGDGNYTLGEGSTIHGTLFLLSNNAILEKDTTVDGSVVMICCNLTVDGDVKGDIILLTGNLKIDGYADVGGDIRVMSGNISR